MTARAAVLGGGGSGLRSSSSVCLCRWQPELWTAAHPADPSSLGPRTRERPTPLEELARDTLGRVSEELQMP